MLSDSDHKAVATELIRIQECVYQMKKMIDDDSLPPKALPNTALDSISFALSLMNSSSPRESSSSSSRNMLGPFVPRRSINKKICGNERYIDDPSPLIDDGFSWRKYGSKIIKTSPHKRSYYRCTYAKDQKCKAKRRVQKIENDPPKYRTTYEGQHICEPPVFSHTVNDGSTDGSTIIRFDQPIPDLALPQPVSVVQQETIGDQAIDHIMNLDYDSNEFLVDVDQSWSSMLPPSPPEHFMAVDDFSIFDFGFF